jgi:hypothetical protein
VATGVSLEKVVPGLWIIIYPSLFVILYLIGGIYFKEATSFFGRAFHSLGLCGLALFTWLLTFSWPWRGIGFSYYRATRKFHPYAAFSDYILALILPLAALILLWHSVKRKEKTLFHFAALPLLTIAGYIAVSTGGSFVQGIMILAFNIYFFFLALKTIAEGVQNVSLATLNCGMLLIAILIISRFFDVDISFIARGIIFIALGVGFLCANLILMKRKGQNA